MERVYGTCTLSRAIMSIEDEIRLNGVLFWNGVAPEVQYMIAMSIVRGEADVGDVVRWLDRAEEGEGQGIPLGLYRGRKVGE